MKAAEAAAIASRETARATFHSASGQLEAKRSELAAIDRTAAEARVAKSVAELAAFSNDVPATQADVDAAEGRANAAKETLQHVTRELHQEEGALTQVGGAAIREELARLEEALQGARQYERLLEDDADAWQLLHETLRLVENDEGAHLGRALAVPVAARFTELTAGRYDGLRLDAQLRTEGVDVVGASTSADVLTALSVGTREQLATLIRLTIAEQLESAIILDDHLVQTDPDRLTWFHGTLRRIAAKTQVVVLTCRPQDYLPPSEMPGENPTRELAGGALRAIDLQRLIRRRGHGGAETAAMDAVQQA